VHSPVGERSVARGLIASSQEPHKRTLFQDIFGDSALSMVPTDPAIQKKAVTTPKPGIGKEIIANILDGPAYLIPPLKTLFEPLMNHFLTPRPPEDATAPGPDVTGEEEDVIMDVDEPRDSSFVSGGRTERVVDAREMDALIELFRHHGVKGTRHLGELI
jgi:NET1-associated nuclear protein 1 (U3 small nucleolar RNA-associated protein 17)